MVQLTTIQYLGIIICSFSAGYILSVIKNETWKNW